MTARPRPSRTNCAAASTLGAMLPRSSSPAPSIRSASASVSCANLRWVRSDDRPPAPFADELRRRLDLGGDAPPLQLAGPEHPVGLGERQLCQLALGQIG